jgi:hypothetical protein
MDVNDVAHSGFRGSDPGIKILWWTQPAVDLPVVLTIDSIPSGMYQNQVTFDPPGPGRQDRPTGFSMPPPGCYRIGIRLGTKQGSVIDRVLPWDFPSGRGLRAFEGTNPTEVAQSHARTGAALSLYSSRRRFGM